MEELLAAQHEPESPAYQQWLPPETLGERFGVAQADFNQIVTWLK